MRLLLAATLALSTWALASEPEPPGLACLTRWYAATAVQEGAQWLLVLPDGGSFPYADPRQRTFDEKLAEPSPQDTFAVPYLPGPIRAVTIENDDPGRIRFEPLFRATYGASAREVDLVTVDFVGQSVSIHRKAAPALTAVSRRLKAAAARDRSLLPFLKDLGGTFVWRAIAGTHRQSPHSYGIAIDINVQRSHYWEWARPKLPPRWQNRIPQDIVDAFEAEGFIWAGRWYHYDTMHFEYRPELLDPSCDAAFHVSPPRTGHPPSKDR